MQKFVFRSALRPNQISFSHDQDPSRTLSGAEYRTALSPSAPVRPPLNVGASVVYFGHGVIRHEDLMRRGPLVASMMALAAQQARP
jgi:hypothetical protein